jgi:hypothetical protein
MILPSVSFHVPMWEEGDTGREVGTLIRWDLSFSSRLGKWFHCPRKL